ncbi:MAG: hypothetical protein U0840_27865 [Gemmataceae bacterium]
MTRWFKRVAVVAAWLGLGTMVLAQEGFPSPVGASRIPEPIGYVPDSPPPTNMVPGPVNPLMAPMGPPASLNLPAGHTSAFQLDHYPPEAASYASVGYMALMRQNLSNRPLVYPDDQNGAVDTGVTPLGIFPQLLNLKNVDPTFNSGVRATWGYLFANEAFELSGFYIPGGTGSQTVASQGRLTVPFTPDNAFPVGLEGNNNLWRQADLVRASFTNSVASAEANYRRWNAGLNELELMVGVRYFYSQENASLYTNDEYYIRNVFNQFDPLRAATYSVTTRTNHLGLQFGGEYCQPIPLEFLQNSVWVGWVAKSTIGINFIEGSWKMLRDDGYVGFERHQNTLTLGSVTELAATADFHILERLRLRAGYTFFLGLGFAPAGSNFDMNFTTIGRGDMSTGGVYWHGPMAELQFLF